MVQLCTVPLNLWEMALYKFIIIIIIECQRKDGSRRFYAISSAGCERESSATTPQNGLRLPVTQFASCTTKTLTLFLTLGIKLSQLLAVVCKVLIQAGRGSLSRLFCLIHGNVQWCKVRIQVQRVCSGLKNDVTLF